MIKATFSGEPLSHKIGRIQRHLEEEHFGSRAIPHCMTHDGGVRGAVRAFADDDFTGQSTPSHRRDTSGQGGGVSPAGWLNFENSTSQSGLYLMSQTLRYAATGDPAALAEAGKAFGCLRVIADLAGKKSFGWLCKPFNGALSRDSSPDQNVCAIAGLWSYLPYANSRDKAWIERLLIAIPSYWKTIGYTINFLDRVWDIRDDHSHMRIFAMANDLAFHLSGDDVYRRESAAIEQRSGSYSERSASLFDCFTAAKPDYFEDWRKAGEFAGATLLFAPQTLNLLCSLFPRRRKRYLAAFARALEHGLIGYDPTYRGHYYQHEVKFSRGDYLWRPMPLSSAAYEIPQGAEDSGWLVHAYPHRLFWLDATSRIPLAYLLYLKNGGEPLPTLERVTREIMAGLDFPHLHWMYDPHGDQAAEPIRYMLRAITSELPNYVAAYWLGQTLDFWKGDDQ